MAEPVDKEKLAQKCYFTTIRPKSDITAECTEALKQLFKKDKCVLQFAMVVEKQSKGVPCTHHVHAYVQYDQPIQLATVKKNIKKTVGKIHGPELDGSQFYCMLKTNCCYTYKDYLGKYPDTVNIHGDDFDSDLFEKHLPDEEMQAMLQAAVVVRPITTMWANHEEKWREFSPNDLSCASCYRYLTHRFYIAKDMDPVPDPRKLQQLVAGIFRYTHKLCNASRQQTAFMEALDQEIEDQVCMTTATVKEEFHGKKRPRCTASSTT